MFFSFMSILVILRPHVYQIFYFFQCRRRVADSAYKLTRNKTAKCIQQKRNETNDEMMLSVKQVLFFFFLKSTIALGHSFLRAEKLIFVFLLLMCRQEVERITHCKNNDDVPFIPKRLGSAQLFHLRHSLQKSSKNSA